MKTATAPLSRAELAALFALLEPLNIVVAAVSGGPDSMALMAALARWNAERAVPAHIIAATVDHGLRPESATEALLVAREARRLGLQFRLLRWKGDKPGTGIQEAAREARYDLLTALCRRTLAKALLTAHTLDDQAETVLMRLARGSGISGLRAMSRCNRRGGVTLLRPLLGVPKARLVASCRTWGMPFADDPSNDSSRFTRVRWRKMMPELAREGLDAKRLALFAERIARADDALEAMAEQVFSRVVTAVAPSGPAVLDARQLYAEPREIVIRVFTQALSGLRLEGDHLRLQRLEDCVSAVGEAVAEGKSLRRTLSGAVVSLDRAGQIGFFPEPPRRRGRASPSAENVADGVCTLGKRGDNT